jgi:hypothetical protein
MIEKIFKAYDVRATYPVPLETIPHAEATAPVIEVRLAGAVVRVVSGMDDAVRHCHVN